MRVKELFTKLLVAEALVGAVALVLAEGFPHQLIAIFGAKMRVFIIPNSQSRHSEFIFV